MRAPPPVAAPAAALERRGRTPLSTRRADATLRQLEQAERGGLIVRDVRPVTADAAGWWSVLPTPSRLAEVASTRDWLALRTRTRWRAAGTLLAGLLAWRASQQVPKHVFDCRQ